MLTRIPFLAVGVILAGLFAVAGCSQTVEQPAATGPNGAENHAATGHNGGDMGPGHMPGGQEHGPGHEGGREER